jgi:hypothetical protein
VSQLSWITALPKDEREQRIEQAWRAVAQTVDGQIVLGSLLEELRLLEPVGSPDETTRHNVAVMIVNRLGRNSVPRVIEALVAGGD